MTSTPQEQKDAADEAKETGSADSSPDGAAPRDAVSAAESFFSVVLEKMRTDEAFAAKAVAALAGLTPPVAEPKAKKKGPPAELMMMDMAAEMAAYGQIELRDKLARFTNSELAAYIRAAKIPSDPPSKLNKTQLLNVIIRSAR